MSNHICDGKVTMSCAACMDGFIPEHFPIPVDVDGNGPALPDEAVGLMCWCGRPHPEVGPR